MERKMMMAEVFAARQKMDLPEIKTITKMATANPIETHETKENTMAPKKEEKKSNKTPKRTGPVEKPAKPEKFEMTDRIAFQALANVVWEEKDRPDVPGMSDDMVAEEFKEAVSLLAPEDEETVLAMDHGKEIWAVFCGLRKELAQAAVAVTTPAPKSGGKKVKTVKERKATKSPKDHSKSNKAVVFKAWKSGQKNIDDLHAEVHEAVKKNTIKMWMNAWKNGKNLPATAKASE